MVNVRQPFVPRQAYTLPKPSLSLADVRCVVPETATRPQLSTSSPELHAPALRLQSAAGADAAGIALRCMARLKPHRSCCGLPRPKSPVCWRCPTRSGGAARAPLARSLTQPRTEQLTARTEKAEKGTPVTDYEVISGVSASLVTLPDHAESHLRRTDDECRARCRSWGERPWKVPPL